MIAKHPVQRVEVSFAGPPPVRQIERASGVSDVDTDGTIVRCLVTGDLATTDYSIYTVLYGFDFIVVAYLVFNSMFLPRVIGVLLAIDAATYLASGFATMIAPGWPPTWGPGSACPRSSRKGRSACGCWSPA